MMNPKEWLKEREETAAILAELKSGDDKLGWLDDAMFFRQAIAACDIVESIEMALRTPGTTAAEVLDENSPIRDAIRDFMTPNSALVSDAPSAHNIPPKK